MLLTLPLNVLTNSSEYEAHILSRTGDIVEDILSKIVTLPSGDAYMSDALMIDGVRINASARLQSAILASVHSHIPELEYMTAPAATYLYGYALGCGTNLVPQTISPNRSTVGAMIEHSRKVDHCIMNRAAYRGGVNSGEGTPDPAVVWADTGKVWIRYKRKVATYGWHLTLSDADDYGLPFNEISGGIGIIQQPYVGHGLAHSDYSQTVRFWIPGGYHV